MSRSTGLIVNGTQAGAEEPGGYLGAGLALVDVLKGRVSEYFRAMVGASASHALVDFRIHE